MATNTVKARIQLKNDTEVNWSKSRFIPLKGEVIIYSTDDTHPFCRLKVGNGETNINDLPFISSGFLNGHQLFVDTAANWQAKLDFIPNRGDIVIWSDKIVSGKTYPGIKIGDGMAYNVDLPFVGDDVLEIVNNHIHDNIRHITAEEREEWNNKITCEDIIIDETLILRR